MPPSLKPIAAPQEIWKIAMEAALASEDAERPDGPELERNRRKETARRRRASRRWSVFVSGRFRSWTDLDIMFLGRVPARPHLVNKRFFRGFRVIGARCDRVDSQRPPIRNQIDRQPSGSANCFHTKPCVDDLSMSWCTSPFPFPSQNTPPHDRPTNASPSPSVKPGRGRN